ncbi:MAG: acetyltransferase [Acidobacteria bacterium]|nr:acetyltransferase [Acidobacteriota bacterium]
MAAGWKHRGSVVGLWLASLSPGGALLAQSPIVGAGPGGAVRILGTDLAVLEMQEPRKDLPCTVTPAKPVLGFDLRFHAGYEISVPLRELAGTENLLTMIFRVTPEEQKEVSHYFVQRVKVPAIEAEARGDAYLHGSFDLGEGRYRIDWLMRDRAERVCAFNWDAEAVLSARDKQMAVALAPGEVQASDTELFTEEPPVARAADEALSVKILVNFAPQNAHASTLLPQDATALVSILRSISREPRFGRFSVVAFNLQEQRILYRQDNADRISFPALGEALSSLKLGTVDVKLLAQKHSETEFLTGLIQREMTEASSPDALIFAGPKAMLEQNIPVESLKETGEVEYPVFYMNYNLQPQTNPWRDAIGRAVRFFRGYEFTISRPRDLWTAVSEMVGRIVNFKQARRTAGGDSF